MGAGLGFGGFSSTYGCFVAGTVVLTEQGHKPIEAIKTGDLVYSENVLTGEKGLKKVTNTFIHKKNIILNIYTNKNLIQTTKEHPFWVEEKKGWVLASNLNDSTSLKSYFCNLIKILKIKIISKKELITVFNLEVEDWNTYFVSTLNILVHNKAKRPFKEPLSGSGKEKSNDVPNWARGNRPYVDENGKAFAKRLMDNKYGSIKHDTGPKSEFNKIKKWGDRGFK